MEYMEVVEIQDLAPDDNLMNLSGWFEPEVLRKLRKEYENNCFGLAEAIVRSGMGTEDGKMILASVITFKNGHTLNLKMKDRNGTVRTFSHHSVVLLGEYIMDVLHQDKLFKTKDYIDMLKKDNPELRLDTMMSFWYTDDGWQYVPTLEEIYQYHA